MTSDETKLRFFDLMSRSSQTLMQAVMEQSNTSFQMDTRMYEDDDDVTVRTLTMSLRGRDVARIQTRGGDDDPANAEMTIETWTTDSETTENVIAFLNLAIDKAIKIDDAASITHKDKIRDLLYDVSDSPQKDGQTIHNVLVRLHTATTALDHTRPFTEYAGNVFCEIRPATHTGHLYVNLSVRDPDTRAFTHLATLSLEDADDVSYAVHNSDILSENEMLNILMPLLIELEHNVEIKKAAAQKAFDEDVFNHLRAGL